MWETDSEGNEVHWSPYTGKQESGPISADQGFWDAYRSTYSLLALWRPDRFALMMEGWLNAWREGGWVPQWSSPGYRGSMTGTMSDVTMSEAIVKLPHCNATAIDRSHSDDDYCINASALFEASLQNAMQTPGPTANEGRDCLDEYTKYGYVAFDGACGASVSRTLNYLHADWALSQVADLLGHQDLAQELALRAANWTKLLDPETGFLAPRLRNGDFASDFDEFAWGDGKGYTEAGPWQYRFEIPYDPPALAAALEALDLNAADLVEQANTMGSFAHAGGYGTPIHEMTEMAANCFGQIELNNQPAFAMQAMQVAFDDHVAGPYAQRAQLRLRESLGLFSATASMYPGDEDNGSMGAWYVLTALGIYPLSPASGKYVLGSPLFANVTVSLPGGHSLVVAAENQGPDNVYVTSVTWNGKDILGVEVAYEDLMQGGVLLFTMANSAAS